MSARIDLSLYKQLEITSVTQDNGTNKFILRNSFSNNYFEVGEKEGTIVKFLKARNTEKARQYSIENYGDDVIIQLHEALLSNGIFNIHKKKKKIEGSFSEKKLILRFPILIKIINYYSMSTDFFRFFYYFINTIFSIVSVYLLFDSISSFHIKNFSLNLSQLSLIILFIIFTTLVHELGHAVRLRLTGKKVHDMNFFIVKLNIGLQVDVSEVYTLNNKMDRIGVAIGGVYTQLAFSGLLSLVLVTLPLSVFNDDFIVFYLILNCRFQV